LPLTRKASPPNIRFSVTSRSSTTTSWSAGSTAAAWRAQTSTSPGHPPYGPESADLDLVLQQQPSDPISGSAPLRASLCEITLA
jgi:hypothetical protein